MDAETVLVSFIECIGVVTSLRQERVPQFEVSGRNIHDSGTVRWKKLRGNPSESSDSSFRVSGDAQLVQLVSDFAFFNIRRGRGEIHDFGDVVSRDGVSVDAGASAIVAYADSRVNATH